MSEDVNFVGMDFDAFSGLKKTLKIPACRLGKQLSHFVFLGPLLTWALVHWASELQKLLAQQENVLVPDYQIRLFFKLFFINFTQAAIFGSGCWATSYDVNEVGVACCTSGLLDFVCYFFCHS